MKNTIGSFKLVRVLIIAMLVIPLAMGTVSPALADVETAPAGILSVGAYHTCALRPSGAVDCWGVDAAGQVSGTATGDNYGRFATHPGPYTQVSAGAWHTCALEPDGAVDCWGLNSFGQATDQPGPYIEISSGDRSFHTCALKPDGALDCWGYNSDGQAVDKPGPYDQLSVAASRTCVLTPLGAVDCWGWGNYGEEADQTGPYTEVSAGPYHTCALTAAGEVDCWGSDGNRQVSGTAANVSFATHPGPYSQVSANGEHTCALTLVGGVECWGSTYIGESEDQIGPYVRVGAGQYHSCALTPLGAVDCWGDINRGQAVDQVGPYGPYNPNNTAPTANPGGPYLGAVNTAIQFDGSLSSDPENDPLTYVWDFDDGATGTGVAPTHSFTAAGIFDVCLTVSDGSLSSSQVCTMAVVYDPSAGFVTGGGWIDSPVGAYKADETLAGKATFGFMSKYQRGASVPTGNTAFQFDLAGLAFASQSYDWLVVNQSGTNAQFKGTGLINGAADPNDNSYKFMLWAGDGSPDTFRIRIWWEDATGEHDVYDNGTAQAIGAGNIVVHTGK
jgi:PKD repeat protein